MPNWCSTSLQFHGSEEAVSDLKDKIEEAMALKDDEWIKENVGFRNDGWLGNLVLVFGGATGDGNIVLKDGKVVEDNSGKKYENPSPHRGTFYVDDLDESENCVNLWLEEAWGPMIDVYEFVVKYYKERGMDLNYDFCSEEPGCLLYMNTDTAVFPEIAIIDDGCDYYYPTSRQEVVDKLIYLGVPVAGSENAEEFERAVERYSQEYDEDITIRFYTDRAGKEWIDKEPYKYKPRKRPWDN